MIRDVLANLSLDPEGDFVGRYAASFAKLFDAQLHARAFAFIPVYSSTAPMEALGADFLTAERAANKKQAEAAVKEFRRAAETADVKGGADVVDAPVALAGQMLSEAARRFDVVVVGQARPDRWEAEILIESALFGSGRPTLVVPYIQKEPMKLERIAVCWDGSRAAARAIGDAMPFLRRARKVDLLFVSTGSVESDSVSNDMREHLSRHGIDVTVRPLTAKKGGEVAAILNHVADAGTDLIVMGGYGHNRLREFILGGVTRGILASMTAPVLMSH